MKPGDIPYSETLSKVRATIEAKRQAKQSQKDLAVTMPHLMNCCHSDGGWCLECVRKLHESRERMREKLHEIAQTGHNPADLSPDLIGHPNRWHLLSQRLASMANSAVIAEEFGREDADGVWRHEP